MAKETYNMAKETYNMAKETYNMTKETCADMQHAIAAYPKPLHNMRRLEALQPHIVQWLSKYEAIGGPIASYCVATLSSGLAAPMCLGFRV